MNSDLENKTGVPTLVSRRQFILAAAATGGAGMLSAGRWPISAHGSSDQAAEFAGAVDDALRHADLPGVDVLARWRPRSVEGSGWAPGSQGTREET